MPNISSQHRIGIYIPNHCSLLTLGAITEPFARVNQMLGEEKFQLIYVGEKAGISIPVNYSAPSISLPTLSLPSLSLKTQAALKDINDYDALIIAAEQLPQASLPSSTIQALQNYYQQDHSFVISLQAGWFWLLESGIGCDDSWAIHWCWEDEVKAKYPQLNVQYERFRHCEKLASCAGYSDCLDFLLAYLAKHESDVAARTIADELYIERDKQQNEQENDTIIHGELPPRLGKAISLMESNLEEPLSADMIADLVHVSRRQLERLFRRYLDTMPARYYQQMRLRKARELLQTTNLSVVQIGLSCGFSSGPHFSSAYKSFFEITPREERSKRLYADRT
ncbi:GlxA family transcriptional regulator [Vibrio ziniensis]|uniref:Helix-turn-helix domain-containing protein n=1 Tax=Vibrio ziniensis TaxID=2711221 RepID=A0A6G7CP56_9VIBR|nr:helix-turn-helix domain-containing protein [Vibrio ziniensis]QIH43931.1 helix-turn-helix domain-containing protein [Vibrio ziniensis]